ncbi:MAG: hypothetical protein IT423_04195 [Pirellulaceae bacterium]|nr:hypothetical protein [Pirellulaceae bacterium]
MTTRAENAALYPQPDANVSKGGLCLVGLCLWLVSGCTPAATSKPAPPAASGSSQSLVPLQVWFVGEQADKPVLERQWQATFDRPVNIRIFSTDQLLSESKVNSDVLVYPAHLIGDLLQRGWLVELPLALRPSLSGAVDGGVDDPSQENLGQEPVEPQPATWSDQTRYDRKPWGLSLSASVPVILANFELPEPLRKPQTANQESPAPSSDRNVDSPESTQADEQVTEQESVDYWQSLVVALEAQVAAAPPLEESAATASAEMDAQAVCDRFLTIAVSISGARNRIGMLFDPSQMTPRLKDENFVKAAQLLQSLFAAGGDRACLLGSHEAAWAALTGSRPGLTIGSPPRPSTDVDKVNSISVRQPPNNPTRPGVRVTTGWNSGRGLVVSISSECRQTRASIDFARWLASDASRQGFAKRVTGMSAESAYAPGSSAAQIQRLVQRLSAQARLPAEPRLPASWRYRQALGEQLIKFLNGQQSLDETLQSTTSAWEVITDSMDRKQLKTSYPQGLGL